MTTQQMHDFFDIIQDKYASPYFTDTEKDLLLNRAQVAIVEEYLPTTNSGMVTPEESSIIFSNLESLVYELDTLSVTSGVLLKTAIQTKLNTASSTTEPYLVILNISKNGIPCRFVRHNDFYKFQNNTFKSASTTNIQYKVLSDKIVFLPASTDSTTKVTVLKRPVDVELNITECELPDRLHNKIVALGIEFAGIASRDEALNVIQNIQK